MSVIIEDLGEGSPGLRSGIDTAYRTNYGVTGQQSKVTDDAAATTRQLHQQ